MQEAHRSVERCDERVEPDPVAELSDFNFCDEFGRPAAGA